MRSYLIGATSYLTGAYPTSSDKNLYYVYVLRSLKDKEFYTGSTKNLEIRLAQHEKGRVPATRNRRPLKFIYAEISNNIKDALHRERYLKTAWGKRYLRKRIENDENGDPIR